MNNEVQSSASYFKYLATLGLMLIAIGMWGFEIAFEMIRIEGQKIREEIVVLEAQVEHFVPLMKLSINKSDHASAEEIQGKAVLWRDAKISSETLKLKQRRLEELKELASQLLWESRVISGIGLIMALFAMWSWRKATR